MGQPIRGMTRPLPVSANIIPPVISAVTLNVDCKASIHNRFDVEVIDAQSGKIKQRAYGENVILNKRWNSYLNSTWFTYIHYGSGSGTPATTDTQLFTFVNSIVASGAVENTDTANCVYSVRKKITLSETTSAGVTITEVGIGASGASGDLCTHAMLKDGNGNQISIAKTNTDIINIYATVFVHYSNVVSALGNDPTKYMGLLQLAAGHNVVFISDNSYNLNVYFARAGNFSTNNSFTVDTSTKKITVIINRIDAPHGNGHGIFKIENKSYNGSDWVLMFTVPFTNISSFGSDIVGEAIGTGNGSTKDFPTYFTDTTNATIFVDGVGATGVTVDNVSTVSNNIHFVTAPASGSVITANYHTPVIAKDANHVFDLTVTIQLGEYSA